MTETIFLTTLLVINLFAVLVHLYAAESYRGVVFLGSIVYLTYMSSK